MNWNAKMFIAPAICLALAGLLLFRMVSNTAVGGVRVLLKLIGFLVMVGGIVLTVLLWMGKIG